MGMCYEKAEKFSMKNALYIVKDTIVTNMLLKYS